MRLWHKDLLPFLPRQQLLSELRECVAISKDIHDKGTTNHILINKIMNYPLEHFQMYCDDVISEMDSRGYNVSDKTKDKLSVYLSYDCSMPFQDEKDILIRNNMFSEWHNDRYLKQCLMNLQEKYDCGGVTKDEWDLIEITFEKYL